MESGGRECILCFYKEACGIERTRLWNGRNSRCAPSQHKSGGSRDVILASVRFSALLELSGFNVEFTPHSVLNPNRCCSSTEQDSTIRGLRIAAGYFSYHVGCSMSCNFCSFQSADSGCQGGMSEFHIPCNFSQIAIFFIRFGILIYFH